MAVEYAVTAVAVVAVAIVLRIWLRAQKPQHIELGEVSGGWLAQLKMSKHDTGWQ